MTDSRPAAPGRPARTTTYPGVFGLILANLVFFLLDLILDLHGLYLDLGRPGWHQLITSQFLHGDWVHLSGNLFFLYIFGRLVEEEEGTLDLVLTYLISGFGANVFSLLFLPTDGISLGASGAVFGLFVTSVLIKLRWHWRNLLEVLILGQFVIMQVWTELAELGDQGTTNRVAHLGGAVTGAVLVLTLRRVRAKNAGLR